MSDNPCSTCIYGKSGGPKCLAAIERERTTNGYKGSKACTMYKPEGVQQCLVF
jgi:hypothetical protein